MSRRTRLLVLLVSTPLVLFVMVGGLLGAVLPAPQQAAAPLRVFEDVVGLIIRSYVEPPNIDKVMDGAMRGLTSEGLLDAGTAYLTPDEVRAYESKTPPPTADVGLVVSRQFYLKVVGIRDGSPAARAGIRSGDFIRAINDTATRDMSAYAGQRMLSGPTGSKVTLVMLRSTSVDPHPIELTREEPGTVRASGRRLAGGEAYVRIASFGPGATAALRSAVQSVGPAATTGLIVDVRDTADGLPEDGIAAARLFVSAGTLATRAARTGNPTVTTAAPGDGALAMPVVVIVSRGTGHAAELFASALAVNKRATLVGEPTAGLAGSQSFIRLPEGHGLLLTTTRYVTPDGAPIHGRGVRPDVGVEVPSIGFDQPAPDSDVLLTKAIEELAKKRRG